MNNKVKNKIDRALEKDISLDEFFMIFIKTGEDPQRREIFKYLESLCFTSNMNIKIRSKALAFIEDFYTFCCGKDVEDFYQDGKLLCTDIEYIKKIIIDNIKELQKTFNDKPNIDDNLYFNYLTNIVLSIKTFKISEEIKSSFLKEIFEFFDLERKGKEKVLSYNESFLLNQINRILGTFNIGK